MLKGIKKRINPSDFELQRGSEELRQTQTNFWIGTTTGAFNLYVISKITDPIVSVKIPQVYSYPF